MLNTLHVPPCTVPTEPDMARVTARATAKATTRLALQDIPKVAAKATARAQATAKAVVLAKVTAKAAAKATARATAKATGKLGMLLLRRALGVLQSTRDVSLEVWKSSPEPSAQPGALTGKSALTAT